MNGDEHLHLPANPDEFWIPHYGKIQYQSLFCVEVFQRISYVHIRGMSFAMFLLLIEGRKRDVRKCAMPRKAMVKNWKIYIIYYI